MPSQRNYSIDGKAAVCLIAGSLLYPTNQDDVSTNPTGSYCTSIVPPHWRQTHDNSSANATSASASAPEAEAGATNLGDGDGCSSVALCFNGNVSHAVALATKAASSFLLRHQHSSSHGVMASHSAAAGMPDSHHPSNCGGTTVEALMLRHNSSCVVADSGTYTNVLLEAGDSTRGKTEGGGETSSSSPPSCEEYCCRSEQIEDGEWDDMPTFMTKDCRLHHYGIRSFAHCLAKNHNTRRLVMIGDSMARQLFWRLVTLSRGDSYMIDITHHSHCQYRLYNTRDSLEVTRRSDTLVSWWNSSIGAVQGCSSDQDLGNCEDPLLEVIFVWAPKYMDTAREVKRLAQTLQAKTIEMNGTDRSRRFVRAGQEGMVTPIQGRNAWLKSWADTSYRSPLATVVPFDEMSRSARVPTGLFNENWHYGCELQQWGDYFVNPAINVTYSTTCLVPDDAGTCQDHMNAEVWRVIANLMCNGPRETGIKSGATD
eukprot:gene18523-25029_t